MASEIKGQTYLYEPDALSDTNTANDIATGPQTAAAFDTAFGSSLALRPELGKLQATLYSKFMQNLRLASSATPTKIVIRGDSVTYGHDTVSADVVPAPVGTLPDGTSHSFTRSPSPWPSVLGLRLNEVYGAGTVIVENQGYSGDWFERGYNRWLNDVNAHVTIYAYGINDAQASYVPDATRNNIDEFAKWCELMVRRDLAWGSAVIFATPTKQLGIAPQSGANEQIDVFREVYYALGAKYGIPVIDMEPMLANANRDSWSDGNHLNTKGNTILGAKMTAPFVGAGPMHILRVSNGTKLLPRPSLDNLVTAGTAALGGSVNVPTPDEGGEGIGQYCQLFPHTSAGFAYFSFYAETPDLYLMPYIYIQNGAGLGDVTTEVALDFGVEQGDNYVDSTFGEAISYTALQPATVSKVIAAGTSHFNSLYPPGSSVQSPASAIYGIRISTPGWHTIRIKATQAAPAGTAATCTTLVQALEFMDWRSWEATKTKYDLAHLSIPAPNLTKGIYYRGVPNAGFSEGDAVPPEYLTTRIPLADLLNECGIPDWNVAWFKAPIWTLTVTSYSLASIRYLLKFIMAPSGAGTTVTAVAVQPAGTVPLNFADGSQISLVRELDVLSLKMDTGDPKVSVNCRELATFGWDNTTKELILTWKTTTSDGSTARNMIKNFYITMQPRN